MISAVLGIYPTPFITTFGGAHLHPTCSKSASISPPGVVVTPWGGQEGGSIPSLPIACG